jgi:hypothetical protein
MVVGSLPLTMLRAKMPTSATAPQMPRTATLKAHRAVQSRTGKGAPNSTKPVATLPPIQMVMAAVGLGNRGIGRQLYLSRRTAVTRHAEW